MTCALAVLPIVGFASGDDFEGCCPLPPPRVLYSYFMSSPDYRRAGWVGAQILMAHFVSEVLPQLLRALPG